MTLFRQEVIEAKRRRLWGEVRLSQPPSLLLWTIILCVAGLLIILALVFGTYVRKEAVTGYLAPEGGVVQIYASHNGRITRVLVREGQHVRAGEPLLILSGEMVGLGTGQVLTAQISQIDRQINDDRQKLAASDASLNSESARFREQIQAQERLRSILEKRLGDQKQSIEISKEQLSKYESLASKGYASQFQVDQMKQQILLQKNSLSDIEQSIATADSNISDLHLQIENIPARKSDNIATLNASLSELQQKRIDLSASQSFMERAPVDGLVSSLQAEVGQTPGNSLPLISIMPDGSNLQAELLVPTRASGMIKPGQEVRLQIDAYPYQRFGFVEGRVISMSKSVLVPSTFLAPIDFKESVYRVRVGLNGDYVLAYGKKQPLRSGMSLAADIVTDRRPLWRQAFDPLLAAERKLR